MSEKQKRERKGRSGDERWIWCIPPRIQSALAWDSTADGSYRFRHGRGRGGSEWVMNGPKRSGTKWKVLIFMCVLHFKTKIFGFPPVCGAVRDGVRVCLPLRFRICIGLATLKARVWVGGFRFSLSRSKMILQVRKKISKFFYLLFL